MSQVCSCSNYRFQEESLPSTPTSSISKKVKISQPSTFAVCIHAFSVVFICRSSLKVLPDMGLPWWRRGNQLLDRNHLILTEAVRGSQNVICNLSEPLEATKVPTSTYLQCVRAKGILNVDALHRIVPKLTTSWIRNISWPASFTLLEALTQPYWASLLNGLVHPRKHSVRPAQTTNSVQFSRNAVILRVLTSSV